MKFSYNNTHYYKNNYNYNVDVHVNTAYHVL